MIISLQTHTKKKISSTRKQEMRSKKKFIIHAFYDDDTHKNKRRIWNVRWHRLKDEQRQEK